MTQTVSASFIDAFAIPLGIFDMSSLPDIDIARNLIKDYSTAGSCTSSRRKEFLGC